MANIFILSGLRSKLNIINSGQQNYEHNTLISSDLCENVHYFRKVHIPT